MATVSANVCASFEIKSIYEVGKHKNEKDLRYLLPMVKLPGKVPAFQLAIDILEKERSKKGTGLYDFLLRETIATVDRLDSTISRVYFKYSSLELARFACGTYLNRTRTFSDPIESTSTGVILNSGSYCLKNRYRFDVDAVHSDYPYELCDHLMAAEMWPENRAPRLSDIRFVVSGVDVDAHKAVVCARSPVFEAMFANDVLESRTSCVQITDVSVETFRLFLQFLYTGSLDESCFDEKLKYCADKYLVTTLSDLCAGLLVQQDPDKFKVTLTNVTDATHKTNRVRAIYQEEATIVEECFVKEFFIESAKVGSHEFRFRNVVMEVVLGNDHSMSFFCWNPNAIGLNVLRVDYTRNRGVDWRPMKKHSCEPPKPTYGFPYFSAEDDSPANCRIGFRVSFKETTEKYKFRLIDHLRGSQLWAAATDRQFTDVEFVVAGKSFHAHQAIVAARCPLFEWVLPEKVTQYGTYEIVDCDPSAFEQLLFFAYTGSLQAPADSEHLLLAAKTYGVVALQEICELALEGSLKYVMKKSCCQSNCFCLNNFSVIIVKGLLFVRCSLCPLSSETTKITKMTDIFIRYCI